MSEGNGAVMRITFLNQDVTIESAHLMDRKYADTAEAGGCNGEDFAFGNVGAKDTVTVALQTIECDFTRCNVAFKRAARKVGFRSFRFEQTVLDQLIFYTRSYTFQLKLCRT